MVSSISGGAPPPQQGGFGGPPSLTADQASAVAQILEEYDAQNLTEDDAKAIVSQISELGIGFGKALEETFSAAGFDAQSVAETAGLEKKGPPPGGQGGPPPSGGQQGQINSDAIAALNTLLESSEGDDVTEDDILSLISELEADGFDLSEGFVNVQV